MISRLNKFGELNKYDIFKNIAFIAMIIDHIGYYFLPQLFFLRVIGRISAVIFAVLYGYGCKKPNNKVLCYGILTTVIVQLFIENNRFPLNILFTFYISSFLLNELEDIYNNHYWCFCLSLIILFPITVISAVFIEYGIIMLFLMLCGRIFKKENKTQRDVISTRLIFIIYALYQIFNFNFNLFESLCVMLCFACIYVYMFDFKIQKAIFNSKIMLFISRYSLELYFIHLLILSVLARCLY